MNFKKLGIAFAGGGGKGAYQIGVWNALRESGLESQVAAIAGTSVGGLNGAMLAQGRYEQAERMWRNVEASNLLTIEGLAGVAQWVAQRTPPGHMLARLTASAAGKGLFKQDGLARMIAEGVDPALLARSKAPLTVAWHHGEDNRVVYQALRDAATVADGLLATAALPMIFDQVRIADQFYSDGGFYWSIPGKRLDNIPVRPLHEAGCDTVIVVCLSQDDLTVAPQQFPGMRVIPIVPRRSPGNVMATLDFTNQGAERRIEQGYLDGREILRHLDMYLDTSARYEGLWEDVRRSALREADTEVLLADGARAHVAVVGDIADFDRIVAGDDFTRPLAAAGIDHPAAAGALELKNAALLAELDRERIRTNVERFLQQHRQDTGAVEAAVLDALAALAPVHGRAGGVREQGTVARLIGMLTGRDQKLMADNDLALAEGQYALLRLVNAVREQGALSLEFSCTLQNRLQAGLQEMARLGQRQNDDLARVYRSLAGVYAKLRDGLLRHGERLDALERQGRVHQWLLHPNRARHHGQLDALAPTLRLATLANEFYTLTRGDWTVEELASAREMCFKVGLGGATVRVGAFLEDLVGDHVSAPTLANALSAPATSTPVGGAAGWLLDLRGGRLDGGARQALACWDYAADTELAAWDMLAELLYHMRSAGLAPLQHDSELAALKAGWSEQLAALDGLVSEGLLPPSFQREVEPVRRAIDAFRLKVPLVGQFSVGKSTLINAWIDREVQEEKLEACTAVPVEFHYAAAGREKLVVHWAPAQQESQPQVEEFDDAYMRERRVLSFAHGRRALHIERHCHLVALARHPDLVVVDTPGLGSNRVDHDTALAHYLGDGVLFILCANRGQIGVDELAFLQRQRQLGQEFSLLVCQEDLNNAGEREALQRSLAEQARLPQGQMVRGCSAHDRRLAGFDDLLAHVERRKIGLFAGRHRDAVEALLKRAEALLARALDGASDQALHERKGHIAAAMAALDASAGRERQLLLAACAGPLAQAVGADVGAFMRGRRSDYERRLAQDEDIGAALAADAQNGFELAVRKHLGDALRRVGQALEQQVDFGVIGAVNVDAGMKPAAPDGGGGMFDMSLLSVVRFVGIVPALGMTIVKGLAKLFSGADERSRIATAVNGAIEEVCAHVARAAPALLEAQARAAIDGVQRQIGARLDTERKQLARIEQQLNDNVRQRDDTRQRADAALAQVRTLLAEAPTIH